MLKKTATKGLCSCCNELVSKKSAASHIEKCFFSEGKANTNGCYIIKIGFPVKNSIYWLYLSAPYGSTLMDLDSFLRKIWLECCGHLSMFRIGSVDYLVDYEINDESMPWISDRQEASMQIKVEKVLSKGLKIAYEYDFGTTTELLLEVVDQYPNALSKKPTLLMRNESPRFPCEDCKVLATFICSLCGICVCDKCSEEHCCERGCDCLLPLVNSPRTGCCGYTGEDLE